MIYMTFYLIFLLFRPQIKLDDPSNIKFKTAIKIAEQSEYSSVGSWIFSLLPQSEYENDG
jgi:hypothetical protein